MMMRNYMKTTTTTIREEKKRNVQVIAVPHTKSLRSNYLNCRRREFYSLQESGKENWKMDSYDV